VSRLDELIEKLCPDGVEYFKVETICNISRGRVMSKNYLRNNKGEYPVYSSQTENDGRLGKISTYDFDGEYLTWTTDGAHAGSVFYRYGKFSITNICGLLEIKEKSKILVKYIYYILKLYAKKYVNKGMGNPKLMSNVMGSIKIPIPPLEIQEEIVHILDSFTKVTSEITEKLETELIARRKQYEFYRDSLLTFGDEVERVKLKDVATIIRGGNFQKKDFRDKGFPCIHYGQIYTKYGMRIRDTINFVEEKIFEKSKRAQKNDIIMAITSENIEDVCKCLVWMGDEDVAISGHTAIIKHNQDPSYLAYYFNTEMFFKQKLRLAHGTKVIEVTPSNLLDIEIPLPPLSEQERIVSILDKFDKLCNDISEGLPAEIDARKKQYEYYRDKLLTFKNISEHKD